MATKKRWVDPLESVPEQMAGMNTGNGHKPKRQAVILNPNGAFASVMIRTISESREVESALKTLMEARGLEGQWSLRITGAELVPVENTA